MGYDSEFLEAIDFSMQRSLKLPEWVPKLREKLRSGGEAPAPIIGASQADRIANAIYQFTGDPPRLDALAGQCLGVHWSFQKCIGNIVGVDPVLTVGGVEQDDGHSPFKFSREQFDDWSNNGVQQLFNLKIHAWLTLPSLEIIDMTFVASLFAAKGAKTWPYPQHEPFFAQSWQNFKGITYKPVAAGADILDKLHLLQFFVSGA
ncbi:MAG: hypothetical protein ACYDBH_10765 [Acidobacteriaceae bacterium]